MTVNRHVLRATLSQLEPTLLKLFGSGWKTHTHWGQLSNGHIRLETLDGHTIKRLVFTLDGDIIWQGLAKSDKSREALLMYKTRTLIRSATRVPDRSQLRAPVQPGRS